MATHDPLVGQEIVHCYPPLWIGLYVCVWREREREREKLAIENREDQLLEV